MIGKLIIILASALGWILSWFFVFLIPIVELDTSTQGAADAWSISLWVYSPLAVIYLGLIYMGMKYKKYLKWLTFPHLLLIPLAGYISFRYLWGCTLLGQHPCHISWGNFEDLPLEGWERFWAPVQLLILLVLVGFIIASWVPGNRK